MSAFIVDDKTINVIVAALKNSNEPSPRIVRKLPDMRYISSDYLRDFAASDPENMGVVLREMNANAVGQRYPYDKPNALPGPWDDSIGGNPPYKYENLRFYLPSAVAVFKSLECYLYQCCEGDVDELPLYNALQSYKDALACHIVGNSKEYEACPWG